MLNSLRHEILGQLGLDAYRDGHPEADPARVAVAADSRRSRSCSICASGVALEAWLENVLDNQPNAAHHALATLARAGARVCVVRFRSVDRASIRACAS